MGKKKHQFINKKSAQKFNVVHRSQRDPLQADEESSQHVLVPVGGLPEMGPESSQTSRDEQVKFGIYYDDDYDYLQHLRPRGMGGTFIMADEPTHKPQIELVEKTDNKINLPAEVLPSKYECEIGMLNKGVLPRGPQPDWDPDIVAALDDDDVDLDCPENVLADDFISLANAEGEYDDDECVNDNELFGDDDDYSAFNMKRNFLDMQPGTSHEMEDNDRDDDQWENDSYVSSTGNLGSEDDFDIDSGEETKSRFTNYSMTSSVIRRTQGLKLLDDRFEQIMEEYDEEEIGAIDHEEQLGTFNVKDELITQIVDEFIEDHTKLPLVETVKEGNEIDVDSDDEKSCNEEELFKEFEKKPTEKWDCESIISTYSNLYNHPKIIDERKPLKLHKKTGIPLGVFEENKDISKKNEDEIDLKTPITLNNIRIKGETLEEKKNRKNEVKEQRRNRRIEKKTNTLKFKDEAIKQERIEKNKLNHLGIKI